MYFCVFVRNAVQMSKILRATQTSVFKLSYYIYSRWGEGCEHVQMTEGHDDDFNDDKTYDAK